MAVSLRGLHPIVRHRAEWALAVARKYRVPVTVTSAHRTRSEQTQLYNRYLRGQSNFPAAKPGSSLHETGRAWDSWVAPEYRSWWTNVRMAAGFRVPAHDWIHAEL